MHSNGIVLYEMLGMVDKTFACCFYKPLYVAQFIHYLRILHLLHNFDFVGFGTVHIIRIVVGRGRRRWRDGGRGWRDVLDVDGAAANALPVAAAAVAGAVAALTAVGFFGREG